MYKQGHGGRIIVTAGRLDGDKRNLITPNLALFFVCTMRETSGNASPHRHGDLLMRKIMESPHDGSEM